jgi:hypothetical protein
MKPVKVYQDCARCEIGKPAKIFRAKHWWTTTPVQNKRDTPQGMPRFETLNTIYTPDAHDGGDPTNADYKTGKSSEKRNLNNPFSGRYFNDECIEVYGEDI